MSAPTASIQLQKLVDGGLVEVERHGRHRYFRLADPAVADALEALAAIAPSRPATSLRAAMRLDGIHLARTCYDHLAGALGVALADALFRERLLARRRDDVTLTRRGIERLEALEVDVSGAMQSRRPLVKLCLDWTERGHHVAGALGAALTTRLFELRWIERVGTGRTVRPTDAGRAGLSSLGVRTRD